jgi:hypothetical protein
MLLLLAFTTSTSALPPTLDSLSPAGAPRGATVAVTLSGKFETWPVHVWTDTPSLEVEIGKAPGAVTIKVAPDAPIGPHLLRICTADGASPLRCFMVGDQLEIAEAEPNNDPATAQKIEKLPVTINGQLEKSGDVDCYAIQLKSGQCLVASVQGRRIGSSIDPMLHLLDPDGVQVAYTQDGLGLDPLLVYHVEKSGKYTLRLSAFAFPPAAEVKLAGGKDAIYRLCLTTGPYVGAAAPSGVTRGQKGTLRPLGWNLASDKIEVDATKVSPGVDHLFIPTPGDQGQLRIEVSDAIELEESALPANVTPPANVTGTIAAPGEEDHVEFTAKKGERLDFHLRTASDDSPLAGLLTIKDSTGKSLAQDEGGTAGDPKLAWTAPLDGRYRATIADQFHNGGPDYRYRLEIKRPQPELRATVENDAYALVPGKTVTIKVAISRTNDYAIPLIAVATGLPPGVTATSIEISPKSGDASLILTAAADAKPASVPFRIMLLGTDPARPQALSATADLRKEIDKPGGQAFIDHTPDLWLTLSPTAETPKPKPD